MFAMLSKCHSYFHMPPRFCALVLSRSRVIYSLLKGVHGAGGHQWLALPPHLRYVEYRGHRLLAAVRVPAVRRLEYRRAQGTDTGDLTVIVMVTTGTVPTDRL